MEWFRHYHGLSTDPKLTVVGLTAEVTHCTAVAAWCFSLEHASESTVRGSVAAMSAKIMAIGLRLSLPECERLIAAFKTEGMVDEDGMIGAWEKRQRRSDSSAERVKAWREKRANSLQEASVTAPVTIKTDDVTLHAPNVNVTEQARAEQNREEKKDGAQAALGRPAKAALWAEMKAQIASPSAGSLVGKWVKDHGEANVMAAHFAAMANPPANYVEWMIGRLRSGARAPTNGSHAPGAVAKVSRDDQLRRREAEQQVLAEGLSPHTAEGRNRITQILGSASNGQRSAA